MNKELGWRKGREHSLFVCACSALEGRVQGSMGRRKVCLKGGQNKAEGKQWALWTWGQGQASFSGVGMGTRLSSQ